MDTPIANNPLAKHFRRPAVYLRLPSRGQFYPNGTLNLPVTGEVPVYPMTIKDELSLKTPDALMNGAGMVDMITSCCPSILDAWHIPVVDIDPILIAIRIASYGEGMDIISGCPHCQADNEHTINLTKVLELVPNISGYDQASLVEGLMFELQPQTFNDINRAQQITYEQQRIVSLLMDSELPEEEKQQHFQESFQKLTSMNVDSIVSCIKAITTEDGTRVAEPALIKDFLLNADRKTYDAIKELIQKTVSNNTLPPTELTCNSCQTAYKTKLEFNQSNFFG